ARERQNRPDGSFGPYPHPPPQPGARLLPRTGGPPPVLRIRSHGLRAGRKIRDGFQFSLLTGFRSGRPSSRSPTGGSFLWSRSRGRGSPSRRDSFLPKTFRRPRSVVNDRGTPGRPSPRSAPQREWRVDRKGQALPIDRALHTPSSSRFAAAVP